jgi:CRISPR-associated Csx2 family protein
MPRKILLSFLGASDYVDCNYHLENEDAKSVSGVKYVQEALLTLVCADFGPNDACYFFLTEEAKSSNWLDDGHVDFKTKEKKPNVGLGNRLAARGLRPQIVPVDIREGYDTDEIWAIFQKVYHCLKKDDEVTIDITHAFRSLPTLAMSLISFARAMQGIRLKGVYYGAFEKLGKIQEVKEMPMAARNAPILDLSAFAELQEWSLAARDFLDFGNAGALSQQAEATALRSAPQDAAAYNLFAGHLLRLTQSMSTVRGAEIVNGEIFEKLTLAVKDLQRKQVTAPFQLLLEKIKEKVERFNPKPDIENGLRAAQWCLDHHLLQQAITILQEIIINFVIEKLDQSGTLSLDPNWIDDRLLVGNCLAFIAKKANMQGWKGKAKDDPRGIIIIQFPVTAAFAESYNSLAYFRNDINHGGFTGTNPPDSFRAETAGQLAQLQILFNQFA